MHLARNDYMQKDLLNKNLLTLKDYQNIFSKIVKHRYRGDNFFYCR